MNKEEIEQLDKYFANTLPEEERKAVEDKMKLDGSFREEAEIHFRLLNSMNEYSVRKSLKQNLESIHNEWGKKNEETVTVKRTHFQIWKTVALAASVALVSALTTFFMLQSYDNEHKAIYQELVKKFNRLNKSVSENIKSNKKPATIPNNYSGSGFLISNNGYIATSYHVIKSADSIEVENEKFGKLKTTFVYGDDTADIALLMITDSRFEKASSLPYLIRSQEANIGETVYTLGYPREDVVYGDGSISATSGYEQNSNSYQVSIPANPGNSGGPMIDQNGSIVGIINGVQTETRGAVFATKSELLLKVIQAMPQDSITVPVKLSARNQMANLSRVNQINRWKDFVFMVKVYKGK